MTAAGKNNTGFSLVEILVVIGIIGVLATIAFVTMGGARDKARDTKRKHDLAQIGRFMSLSCYMPSGGPGTYDLVPLVEELKASRPQYASFLKSVPKDPKSGTDTESFYRYEVNAGGSKCALYANLENEAEEVTLDLLAEPTPGGGTGVLDAGAVGWNGTSLYYQISN